MPVTAGGGTPAPVKKKKPVVPPPDVLQKKVEEQTVHVPTEAEKARQDVGGTTPKERRVVRERILTKHITGYVHDQVDRELNKQLGPEYSSLQEDDQANLVANVSSQYLSDISVRATRLTPGLMRENPNLAAEIIMSQTISTKDVREASEGAHQAWRQQVDNWMRTEQAKYQDSAANPKRPELNVENVVAGTMNLAERGLVNDVLSQGGGVLGEGDPNASAVEKFTAGVGTAFMVPFKAGGAVGGAGLRAAGLDAAADAIGAGARQLEGAVNKGLNIVQGAAVTALTTPLTIWDVAHGHVPRYLHGWGDADTPIGSEITADIVEAAGGDPEDFNGLIGSVGFVTQIAGAEGLLRGFANVKATRTQVGKGYTGESFVEGIGTKTMDKLWEDVNRVRNRPDADVLLQDTYRRGMTPQMAKDLVQAVTKDDMIRTVIDHIDTAPSRALPALRAELKAVKTEIESLGRKGIPESLRNELIDIDQQLMAYQESGMATGAEYDALLARGREIEAALPKPGAPVYPEGTVYHGSKTLEGIEQADVLQYGNREALMGPGLYLTDNPAVAATKGYGGSAAGVKAARLRPDLKLLDADKVLPDEIAAIFDEHIQAQSSIVDLPQTLESFRGKTGAEAVKGYKQLLGDSEIPRSEGAEIMDSLIYRLEQAGYEGWKYKGGQRVKGATPHNVTVLWDTGDIPLSQRISPATPVRIAIDPTALDTLGSLSAKAFELEQRIVDMGARETIFEFPQRGHIQPFMRGVPKNSRIYTALQGFFGETGTLDVSKLFNDFSGKDRTLYNPRARGNPYNWASHNAEAIRKVLNQAKVPRAEQRALIGQMSHLVSDQDFFLWEESIWRAAERGVLREGKRSTSFIPGFSEKVFRITDRNVEERITSPIEIRTELPDGRTISQVHNSLEKADGTPLPTRPEHFRNEGLVPDIALVQEAASSIRYFDNWAKQQPWLGKVEGGEGVGGRFATSVAVSPYKALRVPVKIAKFVALELPRKLLRPTLLVSRIIPMGLKIQADQGLREWLMGYTRKLWKRNDVDFGPAGIPGKPGTKALLPEEGQSALGLLTDEFQAATDLVTTRMNTRLASFNDRGLIAQAQAEHVVELAASPFMKKLSAYGPEGMFKYLTDHPDTRLGRWYREEMKPKILDPNGIDPMIWLRGQQEELLQYAGGDAALAKAVGTGEWTVGRKVDTGATIERGHILDEINMAKESRAAAENGIVRREWGQRIDVLEDRLARMDRMDKLTGETAINVRDPNAVANEIMRMWEENRYNMPEEVIVKRPVSRGGRQTIPAGARPQDRMQIHGENMRSYLNQTNTFLYKGLKPLTKFDISRQTTYRAVLEQTYTDLIGRGYEPKMAFEISQIRAGGITKDLHYDITARSSFDRKMKDYFWFSAVWREQLSTYLYKIPSRHYWPVGLGLRTWEAYAVLDAFKEMGLLEWDEWQNADGESGRELVMNVPWVTDFIAKLQKNEEAGRLNIGGLNPLTPGTSGLLPTLGPGAESILDMTAARVPKGWRPFFEFASDLFTFDQDITSGPSYIPTAIISVAEIMGINIPFDTFNMDDWRQAENKANLQGLKWAASDLASDGIMPPLWKREYEFDPEARAKYQEEADAYNKKLIAHSHDYTFTLGMLHIIGSAVLPGRFTAPKGITNEGEAYYEYMRPLWEARDAGEINQDELYARQNEYIQTHPESWIYSVGVHPGTFGTPTYDSSQYLDAKTFTEKALKQTAYWMETADDLSDVPVGDQDAVATKKAERSVVTFAVDPQVHRLDPEQVDKLGLPSFTGRDTMLAEVDHIYKDFARRYTSEMTDAEKTVLYAWRDRALQDAAEPYGKEGERIIKYYRSTPAERLRTSSYFVSRQSNQVIDQAAEISRHAIAQGSSPMYAAETTGVLQDKVALYRSVEELRLSDPAFDRELRRAEVTLGEKDTTKGRVALYEWLFFGQPDNSFAYQDPIVRALNNG